MRFNKKRQITDENIRIDFFTMFLASAMFTGYIPFASGTFGSLFAVIFFLIPGLYDPVVLLTLILILFFVGIIVSERMMQKYGDDPAEVVIDEVVGMWISIFITLIWFPEPVWYIFIINFLLFRFFDIVKIFPASFFDKLNTGFGVMFDDVISAVYSGFFSVIIIKIILNLW